MNLQRLLLKNTRIARKFLENVPSSILLYLGNNKVKESVTFAVKTKSYSDFLDSNNIDVRKSRFPADYPISDKVSYIDKYSLQDLSVFPLEEHYTIEQSSGYGGHPYYWLRYVGQDDGMANYLQMGLEKSFDIHKRTTLFINTFALGTWVAGIKLARSACEVANKKKNKMTVVNTGTVKEDIINTIKDLSAYYDQILLMGYPPLLEDVIEYTTSNDLFPCDKYVGIIAGGESFPESWREYMQSLLSVNSSPKDIRIFSAFGAADTGLEIGYEQPITIKLRQALIENDALRHEVLGSKVNYVPHFFQYNPMSVFIEEYKKELLFTAKAGIPIVRYNLHDNGGLLSYQAMLKILAKAGIDTRELEKDLRPLRLPVVFVFGRSDGTISVDGANIYIQDIQAVLSNDEKLFEYMNMEFESLTEIQKQLSYKKVSKKVYDLSSIKLDKGKFFKVINSFKLVGKSNKIEIYIELVDNLSFTKKDINLFEKALYKSLTLLMAQQSVNYKALLDENLDSSDIDIHVVEYAKEPFEIKNRIKQKHIIN